MKLNVEQKKDNPLLERVEIIFSIDHENGATPKKETIKEALIKELGEDKDRVEITKIFSERGVSKSKAWAIVNKGEIVKKEEPKTQEKKEGASEEKSEATEQKPDQTEEKPKEDPEKPKEVTQEPKSEERKE